MGKEEGLSADMEKEILKKELIDAYNKNQKDIMNKKYSVFETWLHWYWYFLFGAGFLLGFLAGYKYK